MANTTSASNPLRRGRFAIAPIPRLKPAAPGPATFTMLCHHCAHLPVWTASARRNRPANTTAAAMKARSRCGSIPGGCNTRPIIGTNNTAAMPAATLASFNAIAQALRATFTPDKAAGNGGATGFTFTRAWLQAEKGSDLFHFRPPKKAGGTEHQYEDQQSEGKNVLVVGRDKSREEGLGEPQHDAPQHGAGEGSNPPEHRRGEGFHARNKAD